MHSMNMPAAVRCAVLALVLAGASACAEDSEPAGPICAGEGCSTDCRALSGDNCDLLQSDCRQRVLDAVICVRGTPGTMPQVRMLTLDEYRLELEAEPDAGAGDSGASDEDGGVPDAEAALDDWSITMRLLGLIDSDQDIRGAAIEEDATGVAGYYEADAHRITLIDRGVPEDSSEAQRLFAHELVHALQDQEIGLSELAERTSGSIDSASARSCLIEGEATLYADLAFALLQGFTLDPEALDVRLRRRLKYARHDVVSSASPYTALWHLNYPVGTRHLADAYFGDGNDAVRATYAAPPLSTIHWMHGYRTAAERAEPLVLALACDEATAPADFEPTRGSSMGPFSVFAFLGQLLREAGLFETEAHWQHALEWRQDSLSVFTDARGRVAASWRIRFADAALARDLADRLREQSTLELVALVRGDELELLVSDDPSVLTDWHGTDPESCRVPAATDE